MDEPPDDGPSLVRRDQDDPLQRRSHRGAGRRARVVQLPGPGAEDEPDAGERRDRQAARRDDQAQGRDRAGAQRDAAARARDAAADAREQDTASAEVATPTGRASPRTDRVAARADRVAAGHDRGAAAREREQAGSDRRSSAQDRKLAVYDDLTGALRRGPGFIELSRCITRAHREGTSLVVAVVDVDGLKQINDNGGHHRGDQALQQLVEVVRERTTTHDFVVRFGGDEFVCVLLGSTLARAADLFAEVNEVLATSPVRTTVTAGLAELRPEDDVDDLVQRADAALYADRRALSSGSR